VEGSVAKMKAEKKKIGGWAVNDQFFCIRNRIRDGLMRKWEDVYVRLDQGSRGGDAECTGVTCSRHPARQRLNGARGE